MIQKLLIHFLGVSWDKTSILDDTRQKEIHGFNTFHNHYNVMYNVQKKLLIYKKKKK